MARANKTKELIGYIGMILVVASFIFSGELFYVFNLSGAIISAIYGLLINSRPVLIMNVCIMVFDILHLVGVELIKI